MKRLLIMRHAKSSWKDHSLADFERPLNKRGRRTAPKMGTLMKEKELIPDLIVSSPAARAFETQKLVADAAGFTAEVVTERAIYEASLNTLLNVISSFPDEKASILMTGHNPGFEMVVGFLAGDYYRMPTAALAEFAVDSEEWRLIRPENCRLLQHFIPKEIFS